MPIAPVWIAWAAPAWTALLVGFIDAEEVMLPPIVAIAPPPTLEVKGAFEAEEAPLKATGPAVVAVRLMETAMLLGFRTLFQIRVSMIAR
jgi:hypothetical protein